MAGGLLGSDCDRFWLWLWLWLCLWNFVCCAGFDVSRGSCRGYGRNAPVRSRHSLSMHGHSENGQR
jgi:hypothetical protein